MRDGNKPPFSFRTKSKRPFVFEVTYRSRTGAPGFVEFVRGRKSKRDLRRDNPGDVVSIRKVTLGAP